MTGWLAIAGLGPGDEALVTPEVTAALAEATDVIGYIPYVARVAPRAGPDAPRRPTTASNSTAPRTRCDWRPQGHRVVVVSSGDPGVFAMAAAVFEALEAGPPDWRDLDIRVLPGITAMLAASARVGAPLGHDFCAINLSDNLKPWALIERRLRLAAEADFAIALLQPAIEGAARRARRRASTSCARPARDDRPVLFARAVSTPEETLRIVPLAEARRRNGRHAHDGDRRLQPDADHRARRRARSSTRPRSAS